MTDLIPQKILHLALESEISDLYPDDIYPAYYIVFWWYDIPLGHIEIKRQELPISAHDLKREAVRIISPAIAAHLQEYDLLLPEINNIIAQSVFNADDVLKAWEKPFLTWHKQRLAQKQLSISVVICTRDRPDYVQECLRSLESLSEPPDEIVVVDNAPSSDDTKKIVAQIRGVKYVLEPRPGLSFARNAGIHHSSSELIAYTDDDVKVHPDWLLHLRRSFQDANVMVVTGLVVAAELKTQSQYMFEKYWSFNRGYKPLLYDQAYFQKYRLVGVPAWRAGAGANMAFRRSIFNIIGEFDERLGAGASGCSEDSEMWYRVIAEGMICRYEPTAVVYHFHRRDMEGLHKQLFSYMRGHVTELLIRFERYAHWGDLIRLMLLPVHFSNLLLFGSFKGKHRHKTLLTEILGCFSGLIFYIKNSKIFK